MSTVKEFSDLMNSYVNKVGYAWDTNIEFLNQALFDSLVNKNGPEHYFFDGYSAKKWLGHWVGDCSGTIVGSLRKLGEMPLTEDASANGLFNDKCVEIGFQDLQTGDLVFRENDEGIKNHVGMYYEGMVIHNRSTYHGVKKEDVLNTFTKYGRLKCYYDPQSLIADRTVRLFKKELGINLEYWYKIKYFRDLMYKIGTLLQKWGKI